MKSFQILKNYTSWRKTKHIFRKLKLFDRQENEKNYKNQYLLGSVFSELLMLNLLANSKH
ncbi:hypothetical protein BpHYR1_000764 [Brachionus plicatilis]|uniref:Uncharacterized protein n=1 Tax=Brachionus plicatilis TaxID=10195 RepID=A0A3M7RTA8_BRAPC|nr:hypothetical protein BpHYR1_000764 [Brachionus plicatilis]